MPPKTANKSGKLTKEEELLLLESSRNVSTATSALFYGNAFIVSVMPLWLYWRVQMMDLVTYSLLFLAFSCLSTYLLAFAYRKVQFAMKHRISIRRDAAVQKEIAKELGTKSTKQEKDTAASQRKNKVADREATTFSIFYNNTLYLFLVLLLFWFFKSFHPAVNYMVTTGGAAFLLAFVSTGA